MSYSFSQSFNLTPPLKYEKYNTHYRYLMNKGTDFAQFWNSYTPKIKLILFIIYLLSCTSGHYLILLL